MYFAGWVSLVIISLWVSLVAFIWAFRSGQFSDQGRARYLPLVEELPPPPTASPAKFTKEVYALIAIVALGLLILMVPVIMSLWRLGGTG